MSSDISAVTRDKEITQATKKLFHTAMLQAPGMLALTILYVPSFFLMHVYVPLQVAYCLQNMFQQNFNQLNHHLVLIAIASIVQVICGGIAAWAHNRNGIVACTYAQRTVFLNYLEKDYEFYSDQYVGALGENATAMRNAMSAYSEMMITKLLKHSTIIVGGVAVLLLKAPILAVIAVICMACILGYTLTTSRLRLLYRRQVSEASSELAAVVGDALSHGTTVKSFAAEEYEQTRLNGAIREWGKAQLRSWDLFVPTNSGRSVINAVVVVVLLYVTAHLYETHKITIAVVVLVQLYMIRLIATTMDIADFVKAYDQVMGSVYHSIETMDVPRTIKDATVPQAFPTNIKNINFKKLSFTYGKSKKSLYALRNVDLNIRQGKKIGLVGYSGSGKTTLSKLLVRFLDPTDGEIIINDINIRDLSQQELRQHISYVPQEPLLFHRSIYENIAYGRPDAHDEQVRQAAKLANIDEFVHSLPEGYNTLVGERGIKLSGGQRQRVAIARAILKDAPILVLDEATSALDSKSEHLIQQALWNLMKGRTALVIAHRLSTIQRMDTIVVLEKGTIKESGTHKELLAVDGTYAQLWKHQSGGYIDFDANKA